MKKMIVRPGREKSLLRRHPWIFSGAVKSVDGGTVSGDVVRVQAEDGRFLAQAAFSEKSQIIARVLTFEEQDVVDDEFFRRRIGTAIKYRAGLARESDAVRLIHAESDGLPGLIADHYGGIVVMQLLTAGAVRQRNLFARLLMEATGAQTIYERSDADVRELEGLPPRNGWVAGDPLPDEVVVEENGLRIAVDIAHGHKTGFYLDQRDNRKMIGKYAKHRRVLNAFCYTGGFSLAVLAGGAASVLSIDSSGDALQMGRRNLARNGGLDAARATWTEADVFTELRHMRDAGATFDMIVLDPPKFAPTAAHAERAARAYKDINLLAFKLLTAGGMLATFSCSGGISPDLFQKIVAGAALDAQADAQIIAHLSASADHPIALNFPEGEYLKGLLLRKA